MQEVIQSFSNYFDEIVSKLGTQDTRCDAMQSFTKNGLPSRKNENWRYANINDWFSSDLILPQPNDNFVDLKNYCDFKPDILIVDGCVTVMTDNLGFEVMSLQDALITYPKKIEKQIARIQQNNPTANPFVDLNVATWSNGLYVNVPQGFSRQEPVNIVYINTGNFFLNMLNIISLDKGSNLKLAEFNLGSSSYNTNFVTNIDIDKSANLTHERYQQDSPQATSQYYRYVRQQTVSSYKCRQYNFGGKVSRDETVVDFQGEAATSDFIGVNFCSNDAWHASHVKYLHNASNCTSKQEFRALVAAKSQSSFLGHIFVPKSIVATTAYQDSKSLLLGDTSRVNLKPYLEIFADDVICTHSATVGNVDENTLFYLRSRGMSEPAAYLILLQAFTKELIEACDSVKIKKHVLSRIQFLSDHVFLGGDL